MLPIVWGILLGFITVAWSQTGEETKSPLHTINGRKYIALTEFASSQSVRTEFYDHNNKLVLRFPSKKTVISAHCSFIKIEETVYQLPYAVMFDGKEFYIAAETFSRLLNLENLSDVIQIIDETNAINDVQSKSLSYLNEINSLIDNFHDSSYKTLIKELAEYSIQREN